MPALAGFASADCTKHTDLSGVLVNIDVHQAFDVLTLLQQPVLHTLLPVLPTLPVNNHMTHAIPSRFPPSSPCQQSSDTSNAFTPSLPVLPVNSQVTHAMPSHSSQFSPLSMSTVTRHMHPLHTLIADLPILPVNHPHMQPICSSPCQQSHSTCTLFYLLMAVLSVLSTVT